MITVNRKELATELSLLSSVAETKNTIPVLLNALLDFNGSALKLVATDLDVTLIAEIEATGDAWAGCVPLRDFAKLARLFSGDEIKLSPDRSRLQILWGRSKHQLPVVEALNFPDVQMQPKSEPVTFGADILKAMSRCLSSILRGHDTLSGVLVEYKDSELSIVSTDKHRLSASEFPFEAGGDFSVVLPGKAVSVIVKTFDGDMVFSYDENKVSFQQGSRTLISRLLAGQFPNWRMVLPKNLKHHAEALTAEVQDAVRRAMITAEERTLSDGSKARDAIRLILTRDSLTVKTLETDKGMSEEVVDIQSSLNGDSVLVGLNADYLLDALSSVGEQVKIGFTDGSGVIQLQPLNNDSFRHVIMPVRV